jgi:hypothetical protein
MNVLQKMKFSKSVFILTENTLLSSCCVLLLYIVLQLFSTSFYIPFNNYEAMYNCRALGKVSSIEFMNESSSKVHYSFYAQDNIQLSSVEMKNHHALDKGDVIVVGYDIFDCFDNALLGKKRTLNMNLALLIFTSALSIFTIYRLTYLDK